MYARFAKATTKVEKDRLILIESVLISILKFQLLEHWVLGQLFKVVDKLVKRASCVLPICLLRCEIFDFGILTASPGSCVYGGIL